MFKLDFCCKRLLLYFTMAYLLRLSQVNYQFYFPILSNRTDGQVILMDPSGVVLASYGNQHGKWTRLCLDREIES